MSNDQIQKIHTTKCPYRKAKDSLDKIYFPQAIDERKNWARKALKKELVEKDKALTGKMGNKTW